jgi:hypothetical protein
MRSRRSSRDSRPSITAEESEDSESSTVDGSFEGQLTVAKKPQGPGDGLDGPPAKGLWNSPRDREPLDATSPLTKEKMEDTWNFRRPRLRSAWLCSLSTLGVTFLSAFVLWTTIKSFRERQCDITGCLMPNMSPVYIREKDFDTEHTRFASKYSLYLYREHNIDIEYPVCCFHFPFGAFFFFVFQDRRLTFPSFLEGSMASFRGKERVCKETRASRTK